MLPFALAVSVLLQARAATLELTTVAQGSPRPRECRGAGASSGSAQAGLWSRLRDADAQRYCELLARGYARLGSQPKDAWLAAQAAQALAGERPAVRVLAARALLRLDQTGTAFEQFELAQAADPQALADPKALHDYARAASLAGHAEPALRAYRLLVSRAALLDDPRERAFCQIEAAAHVLAPNINTSTNASADEALGYLAQARQQSFGLSSWIMGLRAIAIQRSNRAEPRSPGSAPPSASALAALGAPPSRRFNDELPLLPAGLFEVMRAALGGTALVSPVAPAAAPAVPAVAAKAVQPPAVRKVKAR